MGNKSRITIFLENFTHMNIMNLKSKDNHLSKIFYKLK